MPTRRQFVAGVAATMAGPVSAIASWEKGVALPFSVQEIYPALWRGQLVVGGGFRARGPGFVADLGALWPTAAVIALRPGARAWTALPDLPAARHHPLLAAVGNDLLAIGGFAATPLALWQMQDQCWILKPGAKQWLVGPSLPQPQAEVAAGVIGGRLFVAGGRTPEGAANSGYGDHRDTGAAWVLEDGRWRVIAAMPTARNSAAAAVTPTHLHVMGGRVRTDGRIVNLADHEAYDVRANRWEYRAPMPAPRGGHAAATLGGRIYCFGGEAFEPARTVFPEAFAYDPEKDRWETVAHMPEPRHGLGAVAFGRAIHLLGGAAEAGGRATRPAHDLFRPA